MATYTYRLTAEGVEEFRRKLESLGAQGKAAMAALNEMSPQFASAMGRAEKAIDAARDRAAAGTAGMKAYGAAMTEVSGVAGGLAGRLGPLGSVLSGLGPIGVAAAAGLGLVSGGLAMIGAKGEELRLAGQKIDSILRATGNAAGVTGAQVEAMVQELEGLTLFDDSEIRNAATQLLAFKSVAGDTLDDLLKMGADYTAVFGGDLVANTVKVGEAWEKLSRGEASGLEKAFDFIGREALDLIEQLATAGRTAEAQGVLFQALNQRIGGTAAGMRSAAGGSKAFAEGWDALLTSLSKKVPVDSAWNQFLNFVGGRMTAAAAWIAPTIADQMAAAVSEIEKAEKELAAAQRRLETGEGPFGLGRSGREAKNKAEVAEKTAALEAARATLARLTEATERQTAAEAEAAAAGVAARLRDEEAAQTGRNRALAAYRAEQDRALAQAKETKNVREQLAAADKAEAETKKILAGATQEEIAAEVERSRTIAMNRERERQASEEAEAAERKRREELERGGEAAKKAADAARAAELAAKDASDARVAGLDAAAGAAERANDLLRQEAQGLGLTAREAAALTGEYEAQRLEQERDEKLRANRVDILQAETEAKKALADAERESRNAIVATLEAERAAINAAYDRRIGAARDKPLLELDKREADKFFADITRQAERISGDVADFLVDAFVNAERAGKSAFENIWDGAEAGLKRFVYRLAATLLEQNLILPIAMEIVGAAPGLFGITRGADAGAVARRIAGGGAVAGGGGGGGIVGGGANGLIPAFDRWIESLTGWGEAGYPIANMEAMGGENAGVVAAGNTLGGWGAFGSASNLLGIGAAAIPGIVNRNAGQAIFGAGGAAIGTWFGGPIGGAIGGTIGNLVGSALFQKKPSVGPGQAANFLSYDSGAIEARSFAQDNGGSIATAQQYGRDTIRGMNALLDTLGENVQLTAGTTFSVGMNQKDKFAFTLSAPGSADKLAEAKGLETLGDAVSAILLESIKAGLVEGLSDNFKTAFDTLKPETTDALADIVQRVAQYEAQIKPALETFAPAASALGVALEASKAGFDAARKSAAELGLALEPLDARAAEAAAALREGFTKSLEAEARDASGRGFLNSLLGIQDAALSRSASNAAGFGDDPAALLSNQNLINEIFAGQTGAALENLSTGELEAVVEFFATATDDTGRYIRALAEDMLQLGGAAKELTDAGRSMLDRLDIRELELSGDDRGAMVRQGALSRAAELAAAEAEGFNAEQLARLAQVIDGELNAALEDFDAAATAAAEAATAAAAAFSADLAIREARLAGDEEAALAMERARDRQAALDAAAAAGRSAEEIARLAIVLDGEFAAAIEATRAAAIEAAAAFSADLAIREARLAGDDRRALELELQGRRDAELAAAEAAGRTAEEIARLAAVLTGEAAAALADFDAGIGGVADSAEDAAAKLRAFNDDLRVRAAVLSGDEMGAALLRFDIEAARQLEAAAAIAGADIAELTRVLEGERAAIIKGFADRAAEEAARAAEEAAREAERQREAERRAEEEAARAREEAAERFAEMMREAAEITEDFETRDLRSRGLDREADILAKQQKNAAELARIDELIRAGVPGINRDWIAGILERELLQVIEGTAGTRGRGEGYNPADYDRLFRVSASRSLLEAGEGLRDADILRDMRAFQLGVSGGVSEGVPAPGTGAPVDPVAAIEAARRAMPLSSLTVGDIETMHQAIVDPLQAIKAAAEAIRDYTATLPAMAERVASQDDSLRYLRTIAETAVAHLAEARAGRRDMRGDDGRRRNRRQDATGAGGAPAWRPIGFQRREVG